jgi:hypothetical protein
MGTAPAVSIRQRIGLVLAGVYCIASIPSALFSTPDGETGPPLGILVVGSALGVTGLLAVVIAWRSGNRAALRVGAGAIIVIAVTGVPAFFVDVSAGLKLLVAISVLIAIAAVVLMFSTTARTGPSSTGEETLGTRPATKPSAPVTGDEVSRRPHRPSRGCVPAGPEAARQYAARAVARMAPPLLPKEAHHESPPSPLPSPGCSPRRTLARFVDSRVDELHRRN